MGTARASVITTEQCLPQPQPQPADTRGSGSPADRADLGFTRVIWLGDGLLNDHTDGHVDNLAASLRRAARDP